jgi:pSer/pThr/pTyr-binding forkhead associated (FHA) protein
VAIGSALGLLVIVAAFVRARRIEADRDVVFERLRAPLYEAATSGRLDASPPPRPPIPEASTAAPLAFDVYEPGRERRLVECERDVVKIGGMANAHVRLSATGVSRLHAVVEREPDGRLRLIDLGAGTFVNGEPIATRYLEPDDVVSIGEAELRVVRAKRPA